MVFHELRTVLSPVTNLTLPANETDNVTDSTHELGLCSFSQILLYKLFIFNLCTVTVISGIPSKLSILKTITQSNIEYNKDRNWPNKIMTIALPTHVCVPCRLIKIIMLVSNVTICCVIDRLKYSEFHPITASGSTWKMTNLEVVNLPINGQFHTLAMGARTVAGDKVEAPVGLSFACAEDGHFRSNRSMPVSGSLRFPGWRMQVFEVRRGQFGPMWECGELMSIGLWVGLIVTLGFTLICAWGFSMLASINVSLPQLWGT